MEKMTKAFLSPKAQNNPIGEKRINLSKLYVYLYAIIQLQYIPLGIWLSIHKNTSFYVVILTIMCIISFILIYILFKYISRQMAKTKETKFIEEQLVLRAQHLKDMDKKYAEISEFKNEFLSEIDRISKFNKNRNTDELINTLNRLSDEINKTKTTNYTRNPAIDSIIYFKLGTAKENNIKMTINVRDYEPVKIPDIDICSIIANLLDNAIESCQKETAGLYIDFSMITSHGFLVIGVKNTCSEYSTKTKKENPHMHGIGNLIVNDIVKQYNGSIERSFENNEFVVNIVLSGGE